MWANESPEDTILTRSECFAHLGQVSLGRIAASIDALPVILPVRFVLSGESVLFSTVPGSKLDAAATGAVVAFQADAGEPLTGIYWSVLLQGLASSVSDGTGPTETPVVPLEPWPDPQPGLHTVRIEASIVSGSRFGTTGESGSFELPDAPSW